MSYRRLAFASLGLAALLAASILARSTHDGAIGEPSSVPIVAEDDPSRGADPTETARSAGAALVDNAPVLLLVTVDGVDWRDLAIDSGATMRGAVHLPRIQALASASGVVMGTDPGCASITTGNESNLSLPGYLELFTAARTSCSSNACPKTATPTFLDDAREAGLSRVASFSSWENLARAVSKGGHGVLVSAGTQIWNGPRPSQGSRLAELVSRGSRMAPYPAPGGTYRPDAFTAEIALEYLLTEWPSVLHVGFGDTDEWAHRGNRANYLKALERVDLFVSDAVALAKPKAVIVVSDHGRAANFRQHGPKFPESARTFVMAFGTGIRAQARACAHADVTLRDVGASARAMLGLSQRDGTVDARPIDALRSPLWPGAAQLLAGSPADRFGSTAPIN